MKILIEPPLRGTDPQGSGYFGAPRGLRTHKGVDIACYKGSNILSLTEGRVTKIGYPYHPSDPEKGHFRYVQVSHGQYDYRYFYVSPAVSVGDSVSEGDILGSTQGLTEVYEGITDHFHLEIKKGDEYIDPNTMVDINE